MRKFIIIVEVEDKEALAAGSETLEEIKQIYQNEVFPAGGYDISFAVKEVTEIK